MIDANYKISEAFFLKKEPWKFVKVTATQKKQEILPDVLQKAVLKNLAKFTGKKNVPEPLL